MTFSLYIGFKHSSGARNWYLSDALVLEGNREYIVSRYNEILNAYDTQAPHFEGDEKYDVRKISEPMMN